MIKIANGPHRNIPSKLVCDSDADYPDLPAFAENLGLALGSFCVNAKTGEKLGMTSNYEWTVWEGGGGGGGGDDRIATDEEIENMIGDLDPL